MKFSQFKAVLDAHPDSGLSFGFDDGESIPPNFHITEFGHVEKNFIDCGGRKRTNEACVLQAWVAATDEDHRLTAGKLAKIVEMGRSLLPSASLEMEVEYEHGVLSQYRIIGCELREGILEFALEDKHTDCLAKEACGLGFGDGGSGGAKEAPAAKCC